MILCLETVTPLTPLSKLEILGSVYSPKPLPIMDLYPSRIIFEVLQDPMLMRNGKKIKRGTYHCLVIKTDDYKNNDEGNVSSLKWTDLSHPTKQILIENIFLKTIRKNFLYFKKTNFSSQFEKTDN